MEREMSVYDSLEIDNLCRLYGIRLKRALFTALLLVNILFAAVYLTLKLLQDTAQVWIVDVVILVIAVSVWLVLLVAACVDWIFERASLVCAICYWLTVMAAFYTLAAISTHALPTNGTMFAYYIILTSYTMLPIQRVWSVVFGITTGLSHLVIFGILSSHLPTIVLVQQLGANIALFTCANLIGCHQRVMTDVEHKRTFQHVRNYVESRIRLEHESQQQERLLLSVIPVQLAVELKNKMLKRLKDDAHLTTSSHKSHKGGIDRKKSAYGRFHDMYVKVHENVSILYADIVNFTPLAAECTAPVLVRMLNELVGKFEQLAQKNDCLRIKILGDCYYCVSGLPVSRPSHAKNCVSMGLDMIDAIRSVRDATGVNVDMRIGVHTGFVLSGIIGLHKWQYDVWSEDVVIANHMESCGKPGHVHVSKATLLCLDDMFQVVPATSEHQDSYLRDRGIETYFISPQKSPKTNTNDMSSQLDVKLNRYIDANDGKTYDWPHVVQRTRSEHGSFIKMSNYLSSWGADRPFAHLDISTATLANNIGKTSVAMIKDNMAPLSCGCTSTTITEYSDGISSVSLMFNDKKLEWSWLNQSDNTLLYNILCANMLLLFLFVIQLIAVSRSYLVIGLYSSVSLMFGVPSVICVLSLLPLKGECFKKLKSVAAGFCSLVSKTLWIRFCLVLLYSVSLYSLPMIDLQLDCFRIVEDTRNNSTASLPTSCVTSDYWTVICLLVLSSTTLFLGTSCFLKLFLMVSAVVMYSITLSLSVFSVRRSIDVPNDSFNNSTSAIDQMTPSVVMTSLYFVLFAVTFHVFDRQTEMTSKLDFIWRRKFSSEHEEVETLGSLNKVLLENILPAYVAEHFLNAPRRKDDLYHETYASICVMFASIPNFYDFCQQNTVSKHGIECIRLLNEIICDFDQLLSKPKYSGVEKIKTIGSTYMAATGLQKSKAKRKDSTDAVVHNVVMMTEFAIALTLSLEKFNSHSFNMFKLRIGLNHGPAIAGVIGACKPQYDIWGDTVNVASRMDSSGIVDKIQCPVWTADKLKLAGYHCECRGDIKVKGKRDPITVYFISARSTAPAVNNTLNVSVV